ncbi:hypothetical protein NQ318_003837 [Aromia moschata]|uniref:Myb/SANT-like DNA-binding domain-containing protein n=1 Tax=Aromia moschata TaxID=1265417 RepID=A0AAV8X6M4_9CUCU|nr:hypothetical protein NQ318_003837 [Aromia moschata]
MSANSAVCVVGWANLWYIQNIVTTIVNAGKHSPIPAADSDGLISHPRLQQKLGSGEGRKFILSQNLSYNMTGLVKVGTAQIKSLKKLWELLAKELNSLLKTNLTASHIENRWRVLERAYKRHVDNQNKTGQGRKYFEYIEEMGLIFKGKKNVNPVVLLSSESVERMPDDESEETVQSVETPRSSFKSQKKEDSLKQKRTPVINRNLTLAQMRRDRREYHEARLAIERDKLEVLQRKRKAMEERNILLKERNEI